MPELQFENLPATQQDPMQHIANRSNQNRQLLQSQYKKDIGVLEKQRLTDKDFYGSVDQLNIKYQRLLDNEQLKNQQQIQQLQRVKSLVDAGQIAPDAGKQAMWRMALPPETEQAMFPTERAQAPFSIGQLSSKAMDESIEDYAGGAVDIPGFEWGPPKKTKESLIDQYVRWREYLGYDNLDPGRKRQLDTRWDADMRSNKRYKNWWSDDKKRIPAVEVKALRAAGKISKAMQNRFVRNISPFGKSVGQFKTVPGPFAPPVAVLPREQASEPEPGVKPIRQRNKRTRQERISYDGGKTWQMIG